MEPIILLIGLVVFGVVGVGMFGVYTLLNPTRTARDRLTEFTGGPGKGEKTVDPMAEKVAERLARLAAPQSQEDQDLLRRMLVQGGYRSRSAPQIFSATRVALALGLPVLAASMIGTWSLMAMAAAVIVLAAIGYYLPYLLVTNAAQNRRMKILHPFPDALDLLVTCVEAGLGLDAAIQRVAKEMEGAAPELALELQLVNHEISAGVSRVDALRHLEQRTGLDEIRSLVNMLTQAERFGTSIAKSLRIHANITREKRMSRAEEEAAKVSPKLTVIMILFLMPTLVVVLLGPAAVNVKNIFGGG